MQSRNVTLYMFLGSDAAVTACLKVAVTVMALSRKRLLVRLRFHRLTSIERHSSPQMPLMMSGSPFPACLGGEGAVMKVWTDICRIVSCGTISPE
jgi:hypothetical protein